MKVFHEWRIELVDFQWDLLFFKANNAEAGWGVEVCYCGWAPRERPSPFRVTGSITPIEVDAPFSARIDLLYSQANEWDAHFTIPGAV